MKKRERWYTVPCSAYGGRSPKTGKRVGSRHRWTDGRCDFCQRYTCDVRRLSK